MGKYAFSITPREQLYPWFHGLQFITLVSHLVSNHTRVKSQLNRINIVAEAVSGCGEDFEKVDHPLWSCGADRMDATEITAIGRGSFSVIPIYVGSPPMK
jgi:hypothetical protein